MVNKMLAALIVAVVAIAVAGCVPPTPTAPPTNLVKDTSFYTHNPNNPFRQPIPTDQTPHVDSDDYITHLDDVLDSVKWWSHDWSKPIFYASSADARRDLWIGDDMRVFRGQRIPTCTRGQIAGEGSCIVVNQVEGCMQHYWGYGIGFFSSWPHAFAADAQPKDFDGTFGAQAGMPNRRGGGAGGLVGNFVWPDELTSVIPRGQVFTLPKDHNLPGNAVEPAVAGDGIGTCQWDLPQGACLQLNPSYDDSSWYTYERVYAQALKTYGAYLTDSNGAGQRHMALSGPPSKASAVNNIFAGCFPDCPQMETATSIDVRYDISQFRVLPFGAPVTVARADDYSTYCGTYDDSPAQIPAPTLTSISPSTASAGSTITLNGTNLTGSYRVLFGTADAWNPTIVSSSQIRCVVPAGSGTVAVSVRTGGGQTGNQNFTYGSSQSPTLSAINPTSGTTAGGTACTLTGTNLTGCSAVSFGGTAASGISVVSSTQVRCSSPAKSAGAYGVTATTGYGTSNSVTYTYVAPPAAPTLSAIAPTSGTTAGGTACTLTGTSLTGCSSVSFGGTAATGISVVSSTQVRCSSPAKSAGTYGVTATTSYGTSNAVSYTYSTTPPPSYTTTLYTPDDARVSSASSNTNYGNTTLVVQKNASVEIATYIKFNLNSVPGSTITSARLRLYQVSGGTGETTEKIYSCSDDSWSESTLKWSNKPAWGTQQASFSTPGGQYLWTNIDVTSYINANFNGDKLVTMVIRDDQNLNKNVQYAWGEGGADNPELVVISQ